MSRGQQIQEQRRRRNTDSLMGKRRRLALDESALDKENFVYRFVNNEPGRIETMTQQDDWEVVQDRDNKIKGDSTGQGSEVSVHAGDGATGSPLRTVLLRKPKQFQDEDRRKMQRQIDESEAALRQGQVPGDGAKGDAFNHDISIERRSG